MVAHAGRVIHGDQREAQRDGEQRAGQAELQADRCRHRLRRQAAREPAAATGWSSSACVLIFRSWHQKGGPACNPSQQPLCAYMMTRMQCISQQRSSWRSHRAERRMRRRHAARVHNGLQVPHALLHALRENLRTHACPEHGFSLRDCAAQGRGMQLWVLEPEDVPSWSGRGARRRSPT